MTDIVSKVIIIILAVLAAGTAKYALHMKNDNPVEQIAEAVIKEETGFEIDLSPEKVQTSLVDGSTDLKHSF